MSTIVPGMLLITRMMMLLPLFVPRMTPAPASRSQPPPFTVSKPPMPSLPPLLGSVLPPPSSARDLPSAIRAALLSPVPSAVGLVLSSSELWRSPTSSPLAWRSPPSPVTPRQSWSSSIRRSSLMAKYSVVIVIFVPVPVPVTGGMVSEPTNLIQNCHGQGGWD
jgi:hypothetical protein